jgi:hypothetical protein
MQQRVDPFIPVSKKRQVPAGPYGQQYLRRPATTAPTAVSGFNRPAQHSPTGSTANRPRLRSTDGIAQSLPQRPRTRPLQAPDRTPATPSLPRHHSGSRQSFLRGHSQKVQAAVLLLGAIGIGVLIQSLTLGELIVGAYAVYALVRRVESRITFSLALIALACILLLIVTKGSNNIMSEYFTIYTFFLLATGVISLGLEIRRRTT